MSLACRLVALPSLPYALFSRSLFVRLARLGALMKRAGGPGGPRPGSNVSACLRRPHDPVSWEAPAWVESDQHKTVLRTETVRSLTVCRICGDLGFQPYSKDLLCRCCAPGEWHRVEPYDKRCKDWILTVKCGMATCRSCGEKYQSQKMQRMAEYEEQLENLKRAKTMHEPPRYCLRCTKLKPFDEWNKADLKVLEPGVYTENGRSYDGLKVLPTGQKRRGVCSTCRYIWDNE